MRLSYLWFAASLVLALGVDDSARAQEVFWAAPDSEIIQASSADGQGQVLSLSTDGAIEYDRNFGSLNPTESQSSFLFSQNLSDHSVFSVSHARATEQRNTVLGFTQNKLTVSYMSGKGRDFSELGGRYAGIDPYQFHGGFVQRYQYDGFAMDYNAGRIGHLQYGEATVEADGLLDRKAQYFQWANDNAYARVSEFKRGDESIGNGYDFGFAVGANKQIGFQAMELDNDRSLQRLRLQFDGKRTRQYWMDLTSHRNALFRQNDDVSVMFTFKTLLGSRSSLVNYAAEETAGANGGKPKKKKRKIGRLLLLIGAGAAAGASLSSSGSDGQDSVSRFRSQQDAAFDVLNGINPQSVRENREYGGWVFVSADGSFGSTNPVAGEAASVQLPDRRFSIPPGGTATATYHTHGGFDPRFDNENFSPQDLRSDRELNVDGYLATPGGLFKYHNVSTDQVTTIGPIAN